MIDDEWTTMIAFMIYIFKSNIKLNKNKSIKTDRGIRKNPLRNLWRIKIYAKNNFEKEASKYNYYFNKCQLEIRGLNTIKKLF